MDFLETKVYYLDERREAEESWVLSFHWQYFNLLSDSDVLVVRCHYKQQQQRTYAWYNQQVISLVSLLRPQRFFGSHLDTSLYRLLNILH